MEIYSKIVELKKDNHPFVLVTVIESSGSVPGKVGFKMIVDSKGNSFGTVGGGAIELEAIRYAKNILKSQKGAIKKYILSNNNVEVEYDEIVVPMKCNGKVTLFYDNNCSKLNVYIFGGGHVGQALSKTIMNLDYYVTIIDDREEFASEEKCPYADKYIHIGYEEYCNKIEFDENSFIIILTYGHSFDYKILELLYKKETKPNYIGVIASKAKGASFIRDLKKEHGEELNLSNLYTPIGLPIGGNTASEIAICIAAEMQAVRYNKKLVK